MKKNVHNKDNNSLKPWKRLFNYIGKLISSAVLILLLIVGAFLVYYLVSVKMVSTNPLYEPKVNLYTIVSGSMEPTIKVYDVVITNRVDSPDDIKIGDVITFKSTSSISKDLIVTHRVVDIKEVNGKKEFVTKGDYNAASDSSTAKYDRIIGKVFFKIPQLGRIQLFLSTKIGWFIVVLLPAAGVIIYDLIKLLRLIGLKHASSITNTSKSKDNLKQKNKDNDLDDIKKDNNELILDSKVIALDNEEKQSDNDDTVEETLKRLQSEIDSADLEKFKEDN